MGGYSTSTGCLAAMLVACVHAKSSNATVGRSAAKTIFLILFFMLSPPLLSQVKAVIGLEKDPDVFVEIGIFRIFSIGADL